MFELAKNYEKGPLSIKEISKRQDVSTAYLEQLLNKLRKSKLIDSQKGPGGGYTITRKSDEISVGMRLNSLEGPVAIAHCLDPTAKECKRVDNCVTRLLWKSLGEKIENFLVIWNVNIMIANPIKMRNVLCVGQYMIIEKL